MRRLLLVAALAVSVAVATDATAAEQQLVRIDVPSSGNVDATQVKFNGADHPKRLVANVLLPRDFDVHKAYPVLYLLHGSGENYASWVTKTKADELTRDLQAIVVMPDAASGFYVNQYNGGRRGSPGWERYFLDELIPEIERRYKIRPGRRWHAMAGFSMGGYGTAYLGEQLPGYFGALGPMSGFLAPRRPEMGLLFKVGTGQDYEQLYGPVDGPYSVGHDPVALVRNLQDTRLFVISGNGIPDPSKPPSASAQSTVTDSAGEAELMLQGNEFADRARSVGVDVTHTVLSGVHTHPYWHEHLRRFLAWDPFKPVVEQPTHWRYDTVADRGHAWELSYRFTAPPQTVQTLERRGNSYSGAGSGHVELCTPDGRGLQADLPFSGRVPARAVSVRILDTRGGRAADRGAVRVVLRSSSSEALTAVLDIRVRSRGTSSRRHGTSVALVAGERRVVRMQVTRLGRLLLRRGARVDVTARHASCPGGRWTTTGRRLT